MLIQLNSNKGIKLTIRRKEKVGIFNDYGGSEWKEIKTGFNSARISAN